MSDKLAEELHKIEQAIAAQESLRGLMPDDQLEATLAGLRRKQAELQAQLTGAGAIAQDHGVAAGAGGAAIGRDVHGDVLTSGAKKEIHHHGPPGPDPADLRTAYLSRLFESCSRLSLAGIDPKAASSEAEARLKLSAVYTALLTLSPEHHQHLTRGELPARELRRQSALEQLDRHRHLVLLGDPGSGKSTFVNFITMCLAGAALGSGQANLDHLTAPLPDDDGQDQAQRQPWRHGPLLPILIILRDFAARGLPPAGERAAAKHLWRFIEADLKAATLGSYARPLAQELLKQGGVLLLDGLDEVPEANRRRVQLQQAITDFAATFSRCRVLVTSRTYAYQQQEWRLPGFAEAVLAPFSDGQIRRFVERWYTHIAALRGLHDEDARGRAELLKQAIFNSDRLRGLAERPLLLTLMASLHAWRGGSLPEKREELYADTVDLLLDWWESPKTVRDAQGQVMMRQSSLAEWLKVDREKVREQLNALAYQAHAAQPELTGTADVAEGELVGGLMRLSQNPAVNPARLVEYLRDRAGLLLPRGIGVYTFPHRTFQEYLAACHLTDVDYPDKVAKLARTEPNRWREVTLLAGAKAARGTASAIWSLVEALCYREPGSPACDQTDAWGALLAGQALVESANLAQTGERHLPKIGRVRAWLVEILDRGDLPAIERAEAGDVLGHLGDPRPGVGLRPDGLPDIVWCEVPEGPFVMGSQDDSLALLGKETPQHQVTLPAFRISRYPVTNAQYAAFVKDGGYTETWRRCWTEAGWQWKEERAGPNTYGGVFDLPNHPIVMIRWYEAVAFCHWLTARLRQVGELGPDEAMTLPSERQWEKAARGPDGRIYPWGDAPDPERANYGDTGLGATSAAGCFPGGASPYGVEGMSGNVWEWGRTKWQESYRDYRDDNNLEGEAPRVLRGGAFSGYHRCVRCAARDQFNPDYRFDLLGFRVVLVGVPPSPLDSEASDL